MDEGFKRQLQQSGCIGGTRPKVSKKYTKGQGALTDEQQTQKAWNHCQVLGIPLETYLSAHDFWHKEAERRLAQWRNGD